MKPCKSDPRRKHRLGVSVGTTLRALRIICVLRNTRCDTNTHRLRGWAAADWCGVSVAFSHAVKLTRVLARLSYFLSLNKKLQKRLTRPVLEDRPQGLSEVTREPFAVRQTPKEQI